MLNDNLIDLNRLITFKKDLILYSIIGLVLLFGIILLAPYSRDFENYNNAFLYGIIERLEPTFAIFTKFTKLFTNNVIWIYFIFGIISISIKLKAFKELSTIPLLTILIYISYYYLLHEVTQIRASVAVGFFLLSIKPLYERNLGKFILFSFCAIAFHYSSIIILPLWFLNPKKLNKYLYSALIPLAYIIANMGFSLVNLIPKLPIKEIQLIYLEHKNSLEIGIADKINIYNKLHLIRCCFLFFLIYYSDKTKLYNKYSLILTKIYSFSLIAVILFSDLPVISFRISEYLGIVEVILFILIRHIIKPSILIIISIIILFLYHSIYNLNLFSF